LPVPSASFIILRISAFRLRDARRGSWSSTICSCTSKREEDVRDLR
jgi:hypothetical protein